MNYICIRKISDFQTIINSPIHMSNSETLQAQESFDNMWAISLGTQVKKISVQDFERFIDSLLQKKKQQLLQGPVFSFVTFYLWFDEMAGQLRFNIIRNHVSELPFGCTVEIISSAQPLLKEFLTSKYLSLIPKNEIMPEKDAAYEENDEVNYALKVRVIYLSPSNYKTS